MDKFQIHIEYLILTHLNLKVNNIVPDSFAFDLTVRVAISAAKFAEFVTPLDLLPLLNKFEKEMNALSEVT